MVLSGYRVPPGVSVVYTAFLSTNSDSQFPEAAAYRPERWLRGSASKSCIRIRHYANQTARPL